MRIMSDKAITKEEVEQAISDLQSKHEQSESKFLKLVISSLVLSAASLAGVIFLLVK